MRKLFNLILILLLVVLFNIQNAQELKIIKLPPPQKEIGKPLMQVLNLRHSTRSFNTLPLPMQELSNLLWAAFGINRPETGKRTAPSALNWQEIDIYIADAEGVYRYDAENNNLIKIMSEDIRALTGKQDFLKVAPVDFIYVTDYSRTSNISQEDKLLFSCADVGFIAQNVYLYCASQGLGTVVRGMIDRDVLSKKLGLKPDQKIMLAQTVGYPKT
jgi:SagB-type dehydrogenase family enzyme